MATLSKVDGGAGERARVKSKRKRKGKIGRYKIWDFI